MAITPQAGYELDPLNPNRVRKIGEQTTPDLGSISSANLGSTPSLNLPTYNTQTPEELLGVTSAQKSPMDIYSQIYGNNADEQNQDNYTKEITNLLGGFADQGAYVDAEGKVVAPQLRAQKENELGLTKMRTDLAELTGGLETLKAESLAIPLQVQNEFTGRGATRAGVEPIQTARLRENAIKTLSLSAQASFKLGMIADAENKLEKAVELEFAPQIARLNYLKQTYEMNKDTLERTDKKRADKLKLELDERTRILENQKEDKSAVTSLINSALTNPANPAPSSVVDSALKSKSLAEAYSLLSPYLKDPNGAQKAIYELENKRLQNRKLQAEIDEKARENGVGTVNVSNLTPSGKAIAETVKNLRFQSKDEAKRIIENVNSRLNAGDTEGALETLKQFGYQKLSVGQQNDFDLYDSAQSAFQSAAGQIDTQNLKAGPYKALLEKAKPFTSIKNDKAYSDLRSIIELGQAQLRKGFYGTAVTGAESANARNFLIVDTDPIDVIKWKLENGANFLDFTNDATIARTTGLPKPNIDDYLTYRVRDKKSGQTGTLPRSEYNANDYEIIQ